MRYALLIYSDESQAASATPEQMEQVFAAYGAYTAELQEAGVMLGGEAFEPTASASTVQVSNGNTNVSDGSAVSSDLQLGGYYVIKADSHDEALKWAAKLPGAAMGKVEVRPLMEFE